MERLKDAIVSRCGGEGPLLPGERHGLPHVFRLGGREGTRETL